MISRLIAFFLGGLGGYALGQGRSLKLHSKKLEEATDQLKALAERKDAAAALAPRPVPREAYRDPDLEAVIHLPMDREDFDTLSEAVCTCLSALAEEGPVDSAELRDCVLDAIYPDFEWPPVPGDPAEAELMWLIADHEARKAVADPAQCPAPPAGVVTDSDGEAGVG